MNRFNKLKFPNGADAVLITSDINRRYFTGMKSSAGFVLAFHDAAYLIIDFRYIEAARKTATSCNVLLQETIHEQIEKLMKKHKAKNLAIEAMDMTVSMLEIFRAKLSGINFITTNELSKNIFDLRMVKSEEELQKIQRAQEIAEEAFDNILGVIKPGVTEKELARTLDEYMLRHGAEALSFETIVLTGKNTSMPHGEPSDDKVAAGDFVLMDFGAVYEGYHSDMTRTVCVGQPTDEMKKVYDIVLEAQLKAISEVKSGITGMELDAIARNFISSKGYGEAFRHSLGHGVGMEVHEYPNASSHSKTVFKPGMVVTMEPGIYLPDKFGVRIEDFVVVTEKSCRNLTKCPKKMIIL